MSLVAFLGIEPLCGVDQLHLSGVRKRSDLICLSIDQMKNKNRD